MLKPKLNTTICSISGYLANTMTTDLISDNYNLLIHLTRIQRLFVRWLILTERHYKQMTYFHTSYLRVTCWST